METKVPVELPLSPDDEDLLEAVDLEFVAPDQRAMDAPELLASATEFTALEVMDGMMVERRIADFVAEDEHTVVKFGVSVSF